LDRKIKVLVAEDSPVDALLIAHSLETEFESIEIIQSQCRSSFNDALQKSAYDIILCDHFMTDITSLEALEKVKKSNANANVPFIVVTSHNDNELARKVINEGAYDYVLKSDLFRLPTAVKNALNYFSAKHELEEIKKGMTKK
jgi:CheY-like chemotaxis protein